VQIKEQEQQSKLYTSYRAFGKRIGVDATSTPSTRQRNEPEVENQMKTTGTVLSLDGEYEVEMVLDSGSQANIIDQKKALEWNLPKADVPMLHFDGFANELHGAFCYGAYRMRFAATDSWGQRKTIEHTFYVFD
jgi:hypothetical protein